LDWIGNQRAKNEPSKKEEEKNETCFEHLDVTVSLKDYRALAAPWKSFLGAAGNFHYNFCPTINIFNNFCSSKTLIRIRIL
jgi:hypothetical protein